MISRTLGAPFGGTTRGGHHGCDSLALSLMTPPNFGGGGGSCMPSIVIVALGEPGVPLICWAFASGKSAAPTTIPNDSRIGVLIIVFSRSAVDTCEGPPHRAKTIRWHERRYTDCSIEVASGNVKLPHRFARTGPTGERLP